MSRAEKIRKLVNAIKNFRGCKVGEKFVRAPQPHAAHRVVKWLDALGFDVEEIKAHMVVICTLESYEQFYAWVKTLSQPAPGSTAAVMGGAA